jgi:predicted oxidoreductase
MWRIQGSMSPFSLGCQPTPGIGARRYTNGLPKWGPADTLRGSKPFMRNVPLGKSELRTSRLAYGCWRLGGLEGGELTPERAEHGRRAVLAAYEAGYTLFDNADIYCHGESERMFGRVLKEVSGMRERILIATKCGVRRAGDPKSDAPYRYDFSAAHISRSCEESLQRLGVETIDLYQLHRPDLLCDPVEVAGAFSRLRQEGKVREFGVSNFRPSQVTMLQQACPMPLVVNQVEISLARADCLLDGTLDQCLALRMTPLAWSPLAAGRLGTSDPIDLRDPDHARRLHIRELLDLIARERGTTRTSVAMAWLLKHPSGIVPIVGSTDPKRIQELTQAEDLNLSREDWYRLLEASLGQRLP